MVCEFGFDFCRCGMKCLDSCDVLNLGKFGNFCGCVIGNLVFHESYSVLCRESMHFKFNFLSFDVK